MCGIAGAINFRLDITKLTKDLYHRGPDEQQTFEEGNLQMHHHRLAIVDIAEGHQPMHDDHLTIIFNGEIYNHQDVRRKYNLKCGTQSDTETILKAYKYAGPACLQEMDGMFLIVIFDRMQNSLFIARDRAGKKPVYYYHKNDQFVFASELNALYHQVKLAISNLSIEQFLLYGAFHGETTPYENVYELLPGHYMEVDLKSVTTKKVKWWSVDTFYRQKKIENFNEAIRLTDDALHASIKRRIESSDLEVGSFLSGGIDSGLVTAIASTYKKSLKTFTVSFDGSYDEAPLAKMVAQQYSTEHTEIRISFDNLQQNVEKILANYGEPFYDDSAIPSYYVSKEARKYLTVILNGDGSDELFGGYRRYVPFSKYDFLSAGTFVQSAASVVKRLMPVSADKQSKLNYMYRLADLASEKGINTYLSATTDIFNGFTSQLTFTGRESIKPLENLLQQVSSLPLSGLEKMMLMDFNAILPDILLVKMDIATMTNSLEGRSPFLARDVLELAPRLKNSFKIKGTQTKYLLRQLAIKYLPATLINQPKRGFEVPLKKWVDNELKVIITDYLNSSASYASNFVQRDFIKGLLDRTVKVPEEKRAKMLYTLFALDVWYQKCVKDA